MNGPMLFVHLLGATIWAGGVIVLGLVAFGARRTLPDTQRVEFFRVIGTGFLILSGVAAAMLLISGSFMVGDLFGGWDGLGDSERGRTVIWKSVLFVAVLALALIHGLVLGPRIRRARQRIEASSPREGDETTVRRLAVASGVTQALLLAGTLAILALAADLGTS
jgi:putative copper export protein